MRTRTHLAGVGSVPFLSPAVARVSESFSERVVVNFQLRYLPKKHKQEYVYYIQPTVK